VVRTIRPALALIIVACAILFAAPVKAQADSPPPGSITVTLPSGTVLPAGQYQAEIDTGKGTVAAKVVVATGAAGGGSISATPPHSTAANSTAPNSPAPNSAAPASAAPASAPAPQSGSPAVTILIVVLAGLLLAGGGYVGYTRFLVPRRHVAQYRAALAMIQQGTYAEAVPVLSRVEHELPRKLRSSARFFAAFALFRLDSLDEAEHGLAALHREDPADVDVAYLLAYLRFTRRDYDGAEPMLEAIEAAGGLDRKPARLLYGAVEFHRALEALRTGRVDAAALLFQKVERLGDFADQVPADLRNQHVVLGAQALFDGDLVAARGQFEDLANAARSEGEQDRQTSMLASADIGLALAAWLENTPKSIGLVDELLVSAAKRLDPDADTELPWTYAPDEHSAAERLAALAEREGRSNEVNERDQTLRSIHLLRAAVVLRTWAAAERTAAGDRERLDEVLGRLARAREYDSEFGDTYLIAGLLMCYLSTADQERTDGVALLRNAQRLGVREPDLVRILNEDAARGRARRDAADRYLQMLDQYIADPSVRQEVRVSLLERLSRYSKVRPLDRRPELVRARVVAPTVEEMNGRSELLRERVNQLITTQGGNENLTEARELARNLEKGSQVLAEQAHSVEATEADLLVFIGDLLLGDNEG
jgi:hypothetical protein